MLIVGHNAVQAEFCDSSILEFFNDIQELHTGLSCPNTMRCPSIVVTVTSLMAVGRVGRCRALRSPLG